MKLVRNSGSDRVIVFLASREEMAAPVSIRAGKFTPHGSRSTFSTTPILIFSAATAGLITAKTRRGAIRRITPMNACFETHAPPLDGVELFGHLEWK